MSEKYYYIKQDNGVTGPFSAYQIIDMIKEDILTENVMISENRIYWNSAANILFPKEEKTVYETAPATQVFPHKAVDKKIELRPAPETIVELKNAAPTAAETEEQAVPFILKNDNPKIIPRTIVVPDPVSVTFSMIWNAPKYLRYMDMMIKYDNLYPDKKQSEAVKYSARTALLCILTEFIMVMTLFGLLQKQYFWVVFIAVLLIMLCQAMLVLLENLCMAAIARRKKLFEPAVLIMQLQLISFTTFMAALPIGALMTDVQNTTHTAWKITAYIMCIASAVFGTGNMSWGLYRAMTDIFNFQLTSKISLIMLNILQWLLLTITIFEFAKILKSIL